MGKADAEEAYRKLEERTRERFHVTGIPYRWSDHDLQPSDRLPFIGRGTPMVRRQWVASGFGLWGMTTSAAAALLLTDLVEGKAHPWAALFDPSRASSFAPNAQMLGQAGNALKTAKARVSPSRRPTALPAPGEGAVITKGGKKVAVYHSPEGRLTAVSATCTHMGCILTWNKAETAWDCPCHGSVFATDGSIVRGPATQPLEAVDIEEGRDRRAA
jgi:Rieske Fe-S protein